MLPSRFIKKHKLQFGKNELDFCREGLDLMLNSRDEHHNEGHAYRLLAYLDEFMGTAEYAAISDKLDLKNVVIAIIWHDCWKTRKDPWRRLILAWDMFWEGLAAARMFEKAARRMKIDEKNIKKVKYSIRKHSWVQFLPRKDFESKVLSDIDSLDGASLERIYLMEKKYLCERPVSEGYLPLGRFALRLFVEKKDDSDFYFDWSKKKFRKMKEAFLKKAYSELDEYEELVRISKSMEREKLEEQLCFMRDKYLTRPELEENLETDPF